MVSNGFILLHRKIVEWEWYQNPNTFRVFLHCLLMANFTDGRFEGKDIKRGQFVTSLPSLSKQTSLSIQQVRTALDHLKSTGEITDTSTSKYRLITVVKYDQYQVDNSQNNSQSTGNQQASNSQSTGEQQQYKKNNKERREKGNNNIISLTRDVKRFTPPTAEEIVDYCENTLCYIGFDAQHFIDYYESNGWMIGKHKMKDWRATVRNWLRRDKEKELEERRKYEPLPF